MPSITKPNYTKLIEISDLNANKERIIKSVIDKFFGGGAWNEEVISKHMSMTVYDNGIEELYIHNILAIKFAPIRTNITVINENVVCTYTQSIRIYQ